MLYKYRSIKSFKYFVDILVKERLYAAPYFKLNDPMEGQYLFTGTSKGVNKDIEKIFKNDKNKIKICSLSKNSTNPLMWSHYADGHKGVVLGVEVDTDKYDICSINYDGPLQLNARNFSTSSVTDILSCKLKAWEYEEEERVFTKDGSNFVYVNLKKIILGSRMDTRSKGLIKELVESVCPHVKVVNSIIDYPYNS